MVYTHLQVDISQKVQVVHTTVHKPKETSNNKVPRKDAMNLTQAGKLNSYQRWMERRNWVKEEVTGGPGMVIRFGKRGGERGLGVRMVINERASLLKSCWPGI